MRGWRGAPYGLPAGADCPLQRDEGRGGFARNGEDGHGVVSPVRLWADSAVGNAAERWGSRGGGAEPGDSARVGGDEGRESEDPGGVQGCSRGTCLVLAGVRTLL